MKLRLRLAVATIAAVVPTLVALAWAELRQRKADAAEVLIAATRRALDNRDLEAGCAIDPAGWAGRANAMLNRPPFPAGAAKSWRRQRDVPFDPSAADAGKPPALAIWLAPVELAALDAELRPELGAALERRAVGELAPGQALALPTWGDAVEIVLATPWRASPCAYVAARGHLPDFASSLWPSIGLLLLPVAGISAALLIAIGPVVRRIRRLTAAVSSSASAGFTGEIPVEGKDEIAVLARSFDAASRAVRTQLAAAERRERILREFLGDTTHDVMIPLTVLKAHLATLQEREQKRERQPQDGSILTSAMDEAHYLGALLQNLGAVAKLDAGQQEPASGAVDLNALVQRVVSRHRTIAARLEIAIEFAVPDEVIATPGDITLLEQAVSNVVYNAVRHNRPGGHVAVILEPVAARDRFSLRVLDDGPGIPAEELSLVIARGFRRDRARSREADGAGLGLDITRRVAELHQLELRFGPSEAGGLEVVLEGASIPTPDR